MELAKRISTFHAVYCSGLWIQDQRYVTALSLLFEKVTFLNQLEFAIDFSKYYQFTEITFNGDKRFIDFEDLPEFVQLPEYKEIFRPLIERLPKKRIQTVLNYLWLGKWFFYKNSELFPDIFSCNLHPNDSPVSCKLIEKGKNGKDDLYNYKFNPLWLSADMKDEISRFVNSGCVPVILSGNQLTSVGLQSAPNAQLIASNIALNSVAMILPATKAARPEVILEAREKLSDHLPYFWSAMLKLSNEVKINIKKDSTPTEIQHQIEDLVSTIVRPAVIELSLKLKKDRKNLFRNIITSAAKGLRVLAGKPPTDLAGLISGALLAGVDTAMDYSEQLRKIESLKQEAGMSYLIELDRAINPKSHNNIADTNLNYL